MARLLVLQADDFASTNAANRGVARAFREGFLTQTNLMAPCAWFSEAAKLAKNGGFPCGVHITLTCEYPDYHFGPLTGARELCRSGVPTAFPTNANELPKEAGAAVFAEVCAQIDRVLTAGITPTHLDAHMGALPRWDHAYWPQAKELWQRYRIPFLKLNAPEPVPEGMQLPVAKFLSFGKGVTLAEKKSHFQAQLNDAVEGLNYVITHAAELTPELQALALSERFDTNRQTDLEMLCDAEVEGWIAAAGLELVSVAEARQRLK